MRLSISESKATSFKPFFAERVMNGIASEEKQNRLEALYESFKAIFRRLAVTGMVVMIALVSYNLARGDNFSSEEIFYASDAALEEALDVPLF